MDNKKGLAILSAVLNGISYPNRILTSEEYNSDKSTGIDVKDLHKKLPTGCYYLPELENEMDTPTADNGKSKIIYCPVKIQIINKYFIKLLETASDRAQIKYKT
jgi:hypothetical protein